MVVEKLASSPIAAASSLRVSNAPGAESIVASMAAFTKAVVAILVVSLPADCVVVVGFPPNAMSSDITLLVIFVLAIILLAPQVLILNHLL